VSLPGLPARLPIRSRSAGSPLWRIHRHDHASAWFGPAHGGAPVHRFDAPAGEFRVCYLADSPEAAFAETLVRGTFPPVVSRGQLASRLVARFRVLRPLRLVALHGSGLVRLGLPAEAVHAHPYTACRALAATLWAHRDRADGIEYRSRWDDDRLCVALFDRSEDAISLADPPIPLGSPTVYRPLLRHYGATVMD
jgi:hypothetical protein